MSRILDGDRKVGIVGIKQLFPYTHTIYHTGMVFTPQGTPEHLYPHLDASLPRVNKQREYQAVTGACLLIDRGLFEVCGGFDEGYRNGYEDVDLCMQVRQRGRTVVCCTSAYIYHYGQISEGRTDDDVRNAARFASKWAGFVKPDRDDYLLRDRADAPSPPARPTTTRRLSKDCIYLADALDDGSALTWINAELALALHAKQVPVFVNGRSPLSPTLSGSDARRLAPLALPEPPSAASRSNGRTTGRSHLDLDLAGDRQPGALRHQLPVRPPRRRAVGLLAAMLPQNGYEQAAAERVLPIRPRTGGREPPALSRLASGLLAGSRAGRGAGPVGILDFGC